MNSGAWNQFEKTIDLLLSLDTRIVVDTRGLKVSTCHRHTSRMNSIIADPDFIEAKDTSTSATAEKPLNGEHAES